MFIQVLVEIQARAVDKYFIYKVPDSLVNKIQI